jgi:hypothetical protein
MCCPKFGRVPADWRERLLAPLYGIAKVVENQEVLLVWPSAGLAWQVQ